MISAWKAGLLGMMIAVGVFPTALVSTAGAADIYIDSVPRGATVSLLLKEDEKGAGKTLGKTPLVVDSSQTPSMRFLIMMMMDDFIKKVDTVPELKDWVKEFKSERYFDKGAMDQNHFNFDTPDSQTLQPGRGELIGIGPIYDLSSSKDSSKTIRICALFIPRGVRREAFYPLMPNPGTFPALSGQWPDILRSKYHLSDDQAKVALESMTRAGKYVVTVKDPLADGSGKLISLTEMPDGTVVTRIGTLRLFPGYNDMP